MYTLFENTINMELSFEHTFIHTTDCGEPAVSEGVVMETTSTTVGSQATYICVEGYEVTAGNIEITCQEDGKWSGQALTCSIIGKCGIPNQT